ncbi:MAG: PBP1A family penicillin-binding protein [Deltaproteobacteria bacterium]|nr:PBP1A family penicillin-binding protein [Deltaproteobacteria bacterium]
MLVCLLAFGAGAGAFAVYFSFLRNLPDLERVEDYEPALASRVVDRNGTPIALFANERRQLTPLEALPEYAPLAFVAAEDASFFQHAGIDYVSIVRAAWVDVRARGIKQGASTITMQLVKQLLLSPERNFSRKIREMVLAKRIESHFTKREILYLYLNQIYFGAGAWGIGEAAETYFGKPPGELTVSESALLAGLPQRPSAYSPFRDPEAAERRRRYVLGRMKTEGFIDEAVYEESLAAPPELTSTAESEDTLAARYFTEEVRRYLFDHLGGEIVLEGGLVVETTLDIELQKVAVEAVHKGLRDLDKRMGYRGPVRQVAAGEIDAEVARLAEENELLADEETGVRPPLTLDEPKLGVVVRVDAEMETTRIVFAPGIEGQVGLEDVSWAREPDPKRRPRPVKQIEEIFAVGDVVRFERLEGDPLVPVEGAGEEEPEQIADERAEPPLDPEARPEPAPHPLARVSIFQEPIGEGALLSMEVDTGEVRALVGGYDYDRSEFNRATQALRQPGSSFKPFIYGAALEQNYTPVSTLWDRPAVYEDPVSGFVWRPQNYGRHFYGPMPMRQALVRSVNNATVHLFRDVGVDYVIDYSRRMGISAPLSRDLSLALGSSSVGLAELTAAYAIYPNKGVKVIPRFITRVTDRNGQILLEDVGLGAAPAAQEEDAAAPEAGETIASEVLIDDVNPEDAALLIDTAELPGAEAPVANQVISEEAAYLMCDLLQAVVQDPRGTGWRLRQLGRPLAGKTGTTNDQNDAWFMGFSPSIATGVWVGRDDNIPLGWGETGSRAAAPIWVEYMEAALQGRPIRDFEEPEHIVKVRIDRASGLLADDGSEDAYFQPFLEGTEPTETTTHHRTAGDTQRIIREDFF